MEIIPALLTKDDNQLINQINRLKPFFNHFQIDVADGRFVPNKTLTVNRISQLLGNLAKTGSFNRLGFDFHLMVRDYKKELKNLITVSRRIRIENVLLHYQTIKSQPVFQSLTLSSQLRKQTVAPFNLGLVLNPEDPISVIKKEFNLKKIPLIQIMSVNPGFQGSPFIKSTLNKIKQLRLLDYKNKIFLDGGINPQTLPLIINQQYKPDGLCIGSYLTQTKEVKTKIESLDKLLTGLPRNK